MFAAGLIAGPALPLGDQDHVAIVAAMRDGSGFYNLVSGIVPAGAFAGRLVPLPTLAIIESRAGVFPMTIVLCATIASILLIGWNWLGAMFADGPARLTGGLLLLGGTAVGALLTIIEPHAGWVALLVAWSLLLRDRHRWIEATALAAAAATIDPAALIFMIVMAAAAMHDGEGRETGGWLIAAALGVTTWVVHRMTLASLELTPVGIGDPAAPIDAVVAALLPGLPVWLGAATWTFAVAGWGVTRGRLAARVAMTTAAGMVLAFVPGMESAATLTVVMLPLGLVFAVDATASLVRQALSRRRITVTRVARRAETR